MSDMPQPIEFFFDFSSPYGYLASRKIDAIGAKHGREVVWKPVLTSAQPRGDAAVVGGQARTAPQPAANRNDPAQPRRPPRRSEAGLTGGVSCI